MILPVLSNHDDAEDALAAYARRCDLVAAYLLAHTAWCRATAASRPSARFEHQRMEEAWRAIPPHLRAPVGSFLTTVGSRR